MMEDTYKTGELFVYVNGDRWELGMVKAPNNTGDGYFCWYSRGDTAANTPTRCMRKLANAGFTHIEEMLYGDELDWCPFGMSGVARCEADEMLKDENDKLRSMRDRWQENDANLREENAKLRELIQLMIRRQTPISPCKNIPCGECPVKDECDQEDALMKELGVHYEKE